MVVCRMTIGNVINATLTVSDRLHVLFNETIWLARALEHHQPF
jgi:hypothetical protein